MTSHSIHLSTARYFPLVIRMMLAISCVAASAQNEQQPQPQANRRIGLDVVVTDADGKPVAGLTPQDFTVLDNGKESKIQLFREFRGQESKAGTAGSTEVTILFDTVNSSLEDVAHARDQVARFLREDNGKLTYPVELLAFNGNGAESIAAASRDGNALADALDKAKGNLHPIRRSEAFWGEVERLQLSLSTLGNIAQTKAKVPGRKLLFWISPGWPMLVGTQASPTGKELQGFFDAIVAMSNGLRESRVVLYSLDPSRTPGANFYEWNYYKGYVKGVPNSNHAAAADLALQVLANQSGGNVMSYTTKDMWQGIESSVVNADDYYVVACDRPPAQHADEYHSLTITFNKPGLTEHTRGGYYNEP